MGTNFRHKQFIHWMAVPSADLLPASSPRSAIAVPLLAAVLNLANAAKAEMPLNQDKTAAVLAELRRPTDDNELKKSQRVSSDRPTDKISGISTFNQAPVSELLVKHTFPVFCLHTLTSLQIVWHPSAGRSKQLAADDLAVPHQSTQLPTVIWQSFLTCICWAVCLS